MATGSSLQAGDLERAVIAGVRAALQEAFSQASGSGMMAPTRHDGPPVTAASSGMRRSFPNDSALGQAPTRHDGPPVTAASSGMRRSIQTDTFLGQASLPSLPQRSGARGRYLSRRHLRTYTKEVVCLPHSSESSVFIIPRGETRTKLAQRGLVGKISFTAEWSEEQMRTEITGIFKGAYALSDHQPFPFQYLSTIKGCKKLMIPKVTSNFPWGGKEVASVCSGTCLYIMAGMEAPAQTENWEMSEDSDFESPALQRRRVNPFDGSSPEQREGFEQQGSVEAETFSNNYGFEDQQRPNDPNVQFAEFIPVGFEEDEAMEEAIRRSLLEEPCESLPSSRVVKALSKEEITGILKAHSEKVVTSEQRPIFVSRGNVWTSALRQFTRRKFAESKDMLYVTFASDENANEDAEDFGGPRREFFRLLVKAIFKDSGAFEESPNGFLPRMNISHMQSGVYRAIGQMMSTIIVQGGETPAFLSPFVVDYLLSGNIFESTVTTDDVADIELREALKKLEEVSTEDELAQALECCDSWRYQIEGLPNPVKLENKDAFIKNAILFHVLVQRKCCYDQLAEGLQCYEVLHLLKENPSIRVLLDMPSKASDVAADVVAALLKPSYSVLGSNKRPREELTVVKFREFLHAVQEKELDEHLHTRELTEEEKEFIQTLTPGHILAFATGSSKVPAVGFFPNPKLVFVHDETKYLPVAHTCSNELHIFVNEKNLADNDDFQYNLLVALMNGAIFSAV